MKNTKATISNYKQLSTLILGLVMALVITVGQVTANNTSDKIQTQEQQDQQTDNDQAEEMLVLKAADAISTSVQVSLTHHYYFISEIIFDDQSKTDGWHIETPVLTTFMHTLFRQIISPNAP